MSFLKYDKPSIGTAGNNRPFAVQVSVSDTRQRNRLAVLFDKRRITWPKMIGRHRADKLAPYQLDLRLAGRFEALTGQCFLVIS